MSPTTDHESEHSVTNYLLSTYATDPAAQEDATPPTPEQMQQMMASVIELEAEMDETGTFVFGGHLHGQDAATVVHQRDADTLVTDGPFAEAHEHIAGFYIIDAPDLDAALDWARRVSACVGRPIEVWPFAGTGRVADQMPG